MDNNQVGDISADDSDDYLDGYILEDSNLYYKIDEKYYNEINNKDKLIDFIYNNSGCGCIIIHHFILYKDRDKDDIYLLYINKNSERDTYYVKYDIYRVKYNDFEKQDIEYSFKNETLYDYSLILESMRECYLQVRMVNKNCQNIFDYNKALKNIIGLDYLYKLIGLGHNTMCCSTCHIIAKEDKFTDHFIDRGYICGGGYWMSMYECKDKKINCINVDWCKTLIKRNEVEEHQIECAKKIFKCRFDHCSYRDTADKLRYHDYKCDYRKRISMNGL